MKHEILNASDIAASLPVCMLPSAPIHAGVTWPTESGINETEATRICKEPIMRSPVYELCRNYTEDALQTIVDSCVTDLQV